MSGNVHEVPALSRAQIREFADKTRAIISWNRPSFPIIDFLDWVLPRVLSSFELHICSMEEMGSMHGLTYPDKSIIQLREDVYDNAAQGRGRDKLTAAHELGHMILHKNIAFARAASPRSIPAYRSSEWQADCFGGELLINHKFVEKGMSPYDIEQIFGVSATAAQVQWKVFRKENLV